MTSSFSATLPLTIAPHETIVIPISMSQPLERGSRLKAIIEGLQAHRYQERTTILVCDYLNRFNCSSEEEAYRQGDAFIEEHRSLLTGFRLIRWHDFIKSRCQTKWTQCCAEIAASSQEGSYFYLKMKKTWEKCLSATQSLEASLLYQREEYAAVLCMEEFDHLFYPKRITNGLAHLYNYFPGKKPLYHHVKLSEKKNESRQNIHELIQPTPIKKERRHIHIAFRSLLDHMECLLSSEELSPKAKKIFAEEAENVLLSYSLLEPSTSLNPEQVG